ncbi:MAG TPA: ROK family protein [Noviherbaspirillum sp.]|uniref:ROK family protein n=1 Tax=Noviherbaspirillum sp. TaxID=1926288 RepID=UPI002B4905A8|nr:ROK family protein [Noviherbaspirillum sp.]HJV85115.1 ROK family protein [Noviherbaspirillum sp.]
MDATFIGAVDIGGTKIATIVAGPQGPLARVTEPTVKSGPEDALPNQVIAMMDAACRQAGVDPAAVKTAGIASCGPFVREQGFLGLSTPNLCGGHTAAVDLPNDWNVIPVERVLRKRFNQLVIQNDCVAALAAERTFGALQGERDCAYATWSTGIGFGLCVDGQILHGKHGNAGHAGHMLMSERQDALCGCGNRGDLEGLISGRNIGRRMNISTAELFRAARSGDARAREIAIEAAQWFGRALYNLTATLDSRAFAVGGSVWLHHGEWLAPIVLEEIERRLPALTSGVTVVTAALGNLVADIGALSLIIPADWIAGWRVTQPWQKLGG